MFAVYVTAYVLRQVQLPAGPERDAHDELRKMGEQMDASGLPNMARELAEGELMDFDAEFEFGLQAFTRPSV